MSTRLKQRTVIDILTVENISPTNMHRPLLTFYYEDASGGTISVTGEAQQNEVDWLIKNDDRSWQYDLDDCF